MIAKLFYLQHYTIAPETLSLLCPQYAISVDVKVVYVLNGHTHVLLRTLSSLSVSPSLNQYLCKLSTCHKLKQIFFSFRV